MPIINYLDMGGVLALLPDTFRQIDLEKLRGDLINVLGLKMKK